jgi:hypothetical protein
MLLSQKAAEAEQEITRLRLGAMKVMEEKSCTLKNTVHAVQCGEAAMSLKLFRNTASPGKGRGTRLILLFSLTAVPIDECFCSSN